MMKRSNILMLGALAAILLNACTAKKRDQMWSQGHGENAELVSNYDGKIFELETQGIIADKAPNLSTASADKVKIAAAALNAMSFPVVNYTAPDAKLLKGAPFKGRPNTKGVYKVLYKLSDNYLKIYKLAKPEDIPFDERTYVDDEKREDGLVAIPLMGYPIKGYFAEDLIRNDNNENTNKLIEKSVAGKIGAKYFRFDPNGGVMFDAVLKANVLPKQLFVGADESENDWFYARTVVATTPSQSEGIGDTKATDQNNESSDRIKFVLTESMLKVVNINIDERLQSSEDLNFATTLIIPIQWKAYKVKMKGTEKDLGETENNEIDYSLKNFIKLDFDKVQTVDETDGGTAKFTQSAYAKVTELELHDNYFSFTLQKHDSNTRERFSFLRASHYKKLAKERDQEYKTKQYFESDQKKFGYFKMQKSTVQNFEIRRKEDANQHVYVSRFNPLNKEIRFYFTDTTPKCTSAEKTAGICLRDAAKKSVKNWNDAFAKAGTGIAVTLDESEDKKLGDLRFNTINLVDSLVSNDLFGLGPKVSDPFTGEIISATTNVHVTTFRTQIVELISNYIRHELDLLKDKAFISSGALTSWKVNMSATPLLAVPLDIDSAPTTTKKMSYKSYLHQKVNPVAPLRAHSLKKMSELNLSSANGNTFTSIREQCPEVTAYVAELKSAGFEFNKSEKSILISCANKLLPHRVLATLIHEMGHNFGLRHNFRASTDAQNFPTVLEEGKILALTSSVMEYPATNDDYVTLPGKYDIAAIKYGYADKVELEGNGELKLDTNRSIQDFITATRSRPLKRYFYCTDEDVSEIKADPLCAKMDSGISPKEIVENIIKSYNASVSVENYRFDKVDRRYKSTESANRLSRSRDTRFIDPLLAIYAEWRSQVARYTGFENRYLENFSIEQYAAKLKDMEKDPAYGNYYRAYEPAAKLIFQFLTKLAMLPVKSCVVKKTSSGKYELIELEKIRDSSFFLKDVRVEKCKDEKVKAHLSSEGMELVSEVGHFLNDIRYDTSAATAALEPLDVIGSKVDRFLAIDAITGRWAESKILKQREFFPSILDEPNFRAEWMALLNNRIIKGVDYSEVLGEVPVADIHVNLDRGTLLKFESEKDILKYMFSQTKDGIKVPEMDSVTSARLQEFAAYKSNDDPGDVVAKSKLDDGHFFFVNVPQAKYAIGISKRFNELQALRKAATDFNKADLDAQYNLLLGVMSQAPDHR